MSNHHKIITLIVVISLFVLPVSAEYAELVDSAMGTSSSSGLKTLLHPIQSSNNLGTIDSDMWFAFAYDFESNFTYEITFDFVNPLATKPISPSQTVYFSDNLASTLPSSILDGAVVNYEYDRVSSGGYSHTYTIVFRWDYLAGTHYVYLTCANPFVSLKVNALGINCTYDPDGTYYEKLYADYLDQIVNAGQGYPVPDQAASDLDHSVGSLSSAEGAVSGQSSSLADSVSRDWGIYKDQAKSLVTAVKPSAVVFATTYSTIVDAFPDEVKALLVAVPLIIFIGWLIGRVKG